MKERYAGLIRAIGEAMDFGPVAPNNEGIVVFDFGQTYVSIRLLEESKTVSLYAFVSELPEDCPKEVLEMLLENQLFFHKTHGAALAISKARHVVLAQLNLHLDILESESLTNAVQNLVETANKTKAEIDAVLSGNPTGNGQSEWNHPQLDMIPV